MEEEADSFLRALRSLKEGAEEWEAFIDLCILNEFVNRPNSERVLKVFMAEDIKR